ncbi:hypothetical protein A2U01_0113007, partial [Trifolium medium]|nr:hypothetical protein [Trifolium medium]
AKIEKVKRSSQTQSSVAKIEKVRRSSQTQSSFARIEKVKRIVADSVVVC